VPSLLTMRYMYIALVLWVEHEKDRVFYRAGNKNLAANRTPQLRSNAIDLNIRGQ
jgi:hypothetical protein